ncbi:unnamed protein product [Chrysoparadoxa australica]
MSRKQARAGDTATLDTYWGPRKTKQQKTVAAKLCPAEVTQDEVASAEKAPKSLRRTQTDPQEPQKASSRKLKLQSRSQSLNRQNHYGSGRLLLAEKIYKDTVHSSISLDRACVRMIDTPQFARLHGLKQLGTSDYVYRGATHTRFEHSIGVAHLASCMTKTLMEQQPGLNITATDLRCVKLAGLLHDLGHGPYSHVWDGVFVKRFLGTWKHEQGSVDMFRYMLQANGIDLQEEGLSPVDVIFIEEMILGTAEGRKGRPPEKGFLYDIVNNTSSGLDVDKLDYFQRDARATIGPTGEALVNLHTQETVVWAKDSAGRTKRMICYPDKMYIEALEVFKTRKRLHEVVYQHKVTKSVELMLVDALVSANNHFRLLGSCSPGHENGLWKLSEAVQDMAAFTSLKDSVVDLILNERNENLAEAKALIQRIYCRDLYSHVGCTVFDYRTRNATEQQVAQEIVDAQDGGAGEWSSSGISNGFHCAGNDSETELESDAEAEASNGSGARARIEMEDIIVEFMLIHHGLKDENPMSNMRFFAKFDKEMAVEAEAGAPSVVQGRPVDGGNYESDLPKSFAVRKVRVFVRHNSKVDAARRAFEHWSRASGLNPLQPALSQA